jgi:caspase domain-containing protein/glucodextranase-like protein
MLNSKRLVTLVTLAALVATTLAVCPALAQRKSSGAAKSKDETGNYFLAETNETLVVEADANKAGASAEPALRLRWANNGTRVLRKVSNRRYRFLWYRDTNFVTFRADSENPSETEMYLETPKGNYVLKRVKPDAAVAAHKPTAKDTEPPQITITSPDVGRGLKAVATSLSRVTVTGRAADVSGVNDVLVQGSPARLDGRGNFAAEVLLKVGENEITVEAVDLKGNRGTTAFKLQRKTLAATPASKPEPAPSADAVAPAAAGRFYALVIGINDYKSLPRLKTAEADAQSVAKVLRERLGFEVELLLNATRQQIVGALNRYRRELDPSSNLLIYYAGHGYFDRTVEKAYWLPVNASLQDNADWISADDVTVNVKGIPARHVLVVSDSCYSGTIVRGVTPRTTQPAVRERYLRRMLEGRSRTLIASGGNEPVADGGEGGHSVFASALLRGLAQTERDAFTAEELFYSYIRESVAGRSEQTPEYNPLRNSGHESGDFVFFRKK